MSDLDKEKTKGIAREALAHARHAFDDAGLGVVVIVFHGEGAAARTSFAGNVRKSEMLAALRELFAKIEAEQ